jgi:hypothetical protein
MHAIQRLACAVSMLALCATAQPPAAPLQSAPQPASENTELRLHLEWPHAQRHRPVPAVLWLEPLPGTDAPEFTPRGHYTLLQKNRMFIPHLQVVPVGTAVAFPNADPFFHNVFSLFDGKRFDLGLYEAGSTKSVTFSREGVSYIFCNIHPEMSAVVVALSTPLYVIADNSNAFALPDVPAGSYKLHIWIEGAPLAWLDSLTRTIHVSGRSLDLGTVTVSAKSEQQHANKFGKPYPPETNSPY